MKRRKSLLTITILLVLSVFLAACNNNMQFLTGGTGGTYYPLGGELAKIIKDETGLNVTAIVSNASADNVADLADGKAQLAFVQTDVMAAAADGTGAFKDRGKVTNVLALGSLYPETIQIVTLKDSGIKTVEDLKGKKVSVGAPGSGTYVNAEQILEIHGMSMSDIQPQNLTFDDSVSGLQDGNIDAAFITAGTPTGSVQGLAATNPINIVTISQDKIDALVDKYRFYAKDTIAAGTYDGLDSDVTTVAVLAMIVVSDKLSEDDVYKMTKAIYENTSKISHAKGKLISLDTALNGVGIKLHPGAEKYYKEKGILK